MPCIHIGKVSFLTVAGDYQPGDPAPAGYLDWHEWAQVQIDFGLRQIRCSRCVKYKFPQELSARLRTSRPHDRDGNVIAVTAPVCKACEAKEAGKHG